MLRLLITLLNIFELFCFLKYLYISHILRDEKLKNFIIQYFMKKDIDEI